MDNQHQAKLVATYITAILDYTPEQVRQLGKELKTNKARFMSTLEMLLKEGEDKGIEIGIKKGEEIGIKKGEAQEAAYQSLLTLLKIVVEFPQLSTLKIVRLTEVKKELVFALTGRTKSRFYEI